MDDRSGEVFLRRKVAGQVHATLCDGAVEDDDVGSRGATKRPRLEPDMEAARPGPSSPRCAAAAPPAGGGATSEKSRVAVVGSTEEYEEETSPLGEGTFGTVFKARHRATGRIVAIKRLSPAGEGNSEEELLQEARLLAACDGVPFVVGFHELVRDPATAELRLVMECAGMRIDRFLRRMRCRGVPRLPEPTLRAVMWQLLKAAEGMHGRGVIHRDIKPENVLVADDLRAVKLCDFGLAMSMSDQPPYDPSGTAGYRAPEILLEWDVYDARVDTWSLGCVMAEIITGRSQFDSPSYPDEELFAILRVLGVLNEEAWPGFLSTPFAIDWMEELDLQQPNELRELIPETVLSNQGFEVLSGLLVCNPDKRLTAAAALKLPWFAEKDELELQLPKKEEAASTLLTKKGELLVL